VPFFAVLILGIILTVRCGHRFGMQNTLSFWLATIAGLCYLGGASIVLVQMVLALMVTGFSAGVFLTLFFALIPITLGIWALRVARSTIPQSIKERLSRGIIGLLGLLFWASLIIGPLIAFLAAVSPERVRIHIPVK
jgi:cadmium resistance protein CadD (predicted permease)